MSTGHFVDNESSPAPGWKPHGLIVKEELEWSYNAAMTRVKRNGDEKDPLEWESTNLWEDLYHHYLLRGYCNNSQIPPHNTSGARCDIVTRYFKGTSRKTLLFTEVKRANKVEATKGIADAENQVLRYCSQYLRAKGSEPIVYACTAIGPYIRCFLVQHPAATGKTSLGLEPALFDLCDVLAGGSTNPGDKVNVAQSTIDNYKDAGDDNHANYIRRCFGKIKELASPPFASPSRPPTSSGPARAPASGSHLAMSVVLGDDAGRSASRAPSEGSYGRRPASQAGSAMSGIVGDAAGRSASRGPSEGSPGGRSKWIGAETPQQQNSPRSTAESPPRGRRPIDPNARNSASPRTPSQTAGHRRRTPTPSRDGT